MEAAAAELTEELGVRRPPSMRFEEFCPEIAVMKREVVSQGGQQQAAHGH
jgi:hypothetical protein